MNSLIKEFHCIYVYIAGKQTDAHINIGVIHLLWGSLCLRGI